MSLVKSRMNSLKRNQFLKNVVVFTGGTAVAQVLLPFVFILVSGRLYGPELQGIYGIYVYITSITQRIACSRCDYAIVVADSDEEAGGAFVLSALLVVLFSMLLGLIMWPSIPQIGMRFHPTGGVEDTLWMVPLTTLICGLTIMPNHFNVRHEKYKAISASNTIHVSVMIVTRLVLGYLDTGYWGMTIGQLLSYFSGNSRMVITLKGWIRCCMFRLPLLRKIVRKNVTYSKYMLPSTIANSLSMNMTGLFIQMQFGGITNGYYSQINRLLGNPLTLISSVVSQVFLWSASADKHNREKLGKIFSTVTKWLTILPIFPFDFLLLWGDPIILLFLGPEWKPIPEYLKHLIPLLAVWFVITPSTNSAIVLGRQKTMMAWQLFLLLTVSIPSLLASMIPATSEQYLLAASLPMVGAYLIFYRFCQTIARNTK